MIFYKRLLLIYMYHCNNPKSLTLFPLPTRVVRFFNLNICLVMFLHENLEWKGEGRMWDALHTD